LLSWNRLAFLYWLYYYGFLNFLKQVFFLLQCKTYLIRNLFGFKKWFSFSYNWWIGLFKRLNET